MKNLLFFWLILILLLPTATMVRPEEVTGVVTKVIDGDTIDIQDFGRVRLADIDCPELNKPGGLAARAYTMKWLQGKKVSFDVDNKTVKDNFGRYVCVIYLATRNGSPDLSKNFNRMIVDSGRACVDDFYNNEFDPADWWGGLIPCSVCNKKYPASIEMQDKSSNTSACGKFVGSKKTKEYHYPTCKLAKKISFQTEIWFSSSPNARVSGYLPCKVCKPP